MTARHRAGRLLTRIALRDDRLLYLRRPLPTLARTCENLKTPNHAGASIITCHHHSISILQPDRASENRRHASLPQGGRETPVTVRRCSMPFCLQTRPKIWPIHPSVPPWSRCTNCTPLSVRMVWIRSEEHTSELQSLMRISYAVF